jgi:hypothetical protein
VGIRLRGIPLHKHFPNREFLQVKNGQPVAFMDRLIGRLAAISIQLIY